jgi:predicted nuclease of predicted toxin-antitoxin system
VKILIDMNLTPAWALFLRDAGFECVHWSDVGDARAPDSELLEWARLNGHVLFTHDMDFGALLAATRAKGPSVLQARVRGTSAPRRDLRTSPTSTLSSAYSKPRDRRFYGLTLRAIEARFCARSGWRVIAVALSSGGGSLRGIFPSLSSFPSWATQSTAVTY